MAQAGLEVVISAVDHFSATAKKVEGSVKGLESRFGSLGNVAKTTATNALKTTVAAGTIAGAVIVAGAKAGVESLADLEDATTSVQGAIDQMGLAGQITATQVAGWANQIEADVQAAFDDKEITAAAETLIRYGKVTADTLQPALVVMTDLAAKTGDVGSAADLLAKALADPTAAAGRLARVGVILTDEEQAQIKAFADAGDATKAQRVLLDALTKSTKGAAAASKGPFRDSLNILNDTVEDAQRALGIGLLPLLGRVSDTLRKKLADPAIMAQIEGFGRGLADGFDKALQFAERIPWGSIGDAARLLGTGAKALLDAFTSMPPWVQTAVLTGWGLNKLTGGAVADVVGELGKGLIKGVLGMNAGVVNITAATVNGPGVPSVPGAPGTNTTPKVGPITPGIGAVAAIDTNFLNEMAARDLGYTLSEAIDGLGDKTTQLHYALVSEQQQTENLLRANLNRPLPAPTVNVTIYGSGSYGNTSTSYYGGSQPPAYSH